MWWRLLAVGGACLIALLAPRVAPAAGVSRVPLTGYLAQPTEQLALPGDQASGEITPEGDVYTGWAEYELSAGARLTPWAQRTRILPQPAVPRYQSALARDGIDYTETVFTIPVGGLPVVYLALTARNPGSRRRRARAAMQVAYTRGRPVTGLHRIPTRAYRYERPVAGTGDGFFFQLGQAFDASWRYSLAGRDVDRDGLLLVREPAGGAAVPTPAAATPSAPHAQWAVDRALAPGAAVTWTWQIPLRPPAASPDVDRALDAVPLPTARAGLAAYWRAAERGLTSIDVPETRVDAVYDANIVAMLQSRYLTPSGWVQGVNRIQYQSYWIRDSSVDTVALDEVGLHRDAAQNLAFLPYWQQPDGLYISRAGQQDGVGQALWELDEHAALTGSQAYAAAQLPNVTPAVGWIARMTAASPRGLLPPSTISDDEFLIGSHITGDNVWAAVGLRSAIALSRLAGRDDLAAAWRRVDSRFEAALRLALHGAVARSGHITPGLDGPGGYDWGNYWTAYADPILAAGSPAVQATLRWERAHSREGLATYADGRLLHDYLGFPVDETELEAGDIPTALAGFYAEVVHTTAPGYGWEDGPAPFGSRQTTLNLAPHGTFSGQFVTLLRNLLVSDESADGVELLRGVSPAWMAPRDRISVTGAPTRFGTVSFTLTVNARGDGATVRWSRTGVGSLSWTLPYWAGGSRRAVPLHGSHGSATARWPGRRPSQPSVSAATAALNAAYRAYGREAPLVPAPGWLAR